MKSIVRKLVISGFALFTQPSLATNYTEITECGFQITQPGRYKVVNNLFCDFNDPFAIAIQNTHNVDLDLQQYQLRMPGGQQRGIGIYLHNSRNVEIKADKNAFIYNFQTGISLYGYRSGGNLFYNRDIEVKGGGMRLLNNQVGVLFRIAREVEVKEVRTQNNAKDWSLVEAKKIDFDKINLPANQY